MLLRIALANCSMIFSINQSRECSQIGYTNMSQKIQQSQSASGITLMSTCCAAVLFGVYSQTSAFEAMRIVLSTVWTRVHSCCSHIILFAGDLICIHKCPVKKCKRNTTLSHANTGIFVLHFVSFWGTLNANTSF